MRFLTLVFVLAISTSVFACGEGKTTDSSVKTETTKKKNSTEG